MAEIRVGRVFKEFMGHVGASVRSETLLSYVGDAFGGLLKWLCGEICFNCISAHIFDRFVCRVRVGADPIGVGVRCVWLAGEWVLLGKCVQWVN